MTRTLPKRRYDLYDPTQRDYRIHYAAQCIKRGLVNGGSRHFDTCFEMGDGDDVVVALLERGLRSATLREAMYSSTLFSLDSCLQSFPHFASAYAALDPKYLVRPASR